MPRFFIDRPVFAWVISLGILLAGLLALRALPIEQYPQVAPPSLSIGVTYPGADAATIEQNVTQVIEQQLNGVEGFLYMSSSSDSDGSASINLTFTSGTDIDTAQMNVQNRLSAVEARLPEEVRRQGIQVRQASSGFLAIVALVSKSGRTDQLELGNIANTQIIDEIRRVSGVGDVMLFGSEYSMRIWLDPQQLAAYSLSPADVLRAVQEQNSQTAGGALGGMPIVRDTELSATIITQNRFTTEDQFRQIILKANPDGSTVRVGDVARVELGAATYDTSVRLNNQPAAAMAIQLATGANSLATAQGVKARMEELARNLPPDVAWTIPFDTTPFVTISVEQVAQTLVEAMLLVFIVMFLFLQNWRATLIPSLVVPIALAGACLGLWIAGFSINVLSLFAMVLAIGILVDDAIVVIENVERIMTEEGLPPREATIKAMEQISGAIVGITLVLSAVFVPMAFFPGSTGGIYRQFAVTLAISILFSALLALTLTPALCATFLKPASHHTDERPGFVGRFFRGFNRGFDRTTKRYHGIVGRILSVPMRGLAIFVLLVALAGFLFMRLPGGFLPEEDQGFLITIVQAPPGTAQPVTDRAIEQVEAHWRSKAEVANFVTIRGFSFFGRGQNAAIMFVSLNHWDERKAAESKSASIAAEAMGRFAGIKEAMVFILSPPAIPQLGNASGFQFMLQDRTGAGREALTQARNQILGAAAQNPELVGVRPEDMGDAPQLRVEIDRVRARALGLSIGDVNNTLSIAFGSAYANDFTHDGRVLRVMLQAEAPYRMTPDDVLNLRVRNTQGQMVPFAAFTEVSWTAGPTQLARYNGYPAMTIAGSPAPGISTGEALAQMEALGDALPPSLGYEWTGLSFEEKQAAGQVGALLMLSLVVVFLLLAALYESWSTPIAVLLIVPMGLLGAVLFSMMRGLSADVYFNVGLIAIIGLAAKNAILIVEFAIDLEEQGHSPFEAVLEAARLRLRPIIMTSLAFILGMVPLVISTGAGAASRIAVGTGVMGGMIAATAIGIFLIPLLYLLVRNSVSRIRSWREKSQ